MNRIHSFFPLFRFFMGFLALNFAAGDSGFMSSFGDDGGAPPVDLGEEEGDGGEEGAAAAVTTDEDAEGKEGEEVAGKEKTAPGDAAPDLANPLSKEAKKALGELKQSNPAAWKEVNKRIWALNGLDSKIKEHFDNGVDDAIKLKTDVDSFLQDAQADNLQEIKEELSGFRGIDRKLMNGDPTFLNELPPEMQTGLFKMMPTFLEDWRGKDSDSYERYFGALVVDTLRSTKFSQNLEVALDKLEEMGLDDARVKKIHDRLAGNLKWINDLDTKAKTPPEKKVTAADDPVTAREKSVQAGELKLSQTRLTTKFRGTFDPKMMTSLKAIAAGADGKIPANVNKAEVVLRAMKNLIGTLGSQVGKRVDDYLAGKDEEGAFKYLQTQVTDKRITEAVTSAYRYLYKNNGVGGAKPAPGGDKGKEGAGKENAIPGFVTVNYDPKASSIDVAATTKLAVSMRLSYRQLVSQNKCVLRNGKRVTWPRDAQAEQ